jgi:hypothetical protein
MYIPREVTTMANGRSLHIGLNAVDPKHYQGWDGQLLACEADAQDMEQIARAQGFETQLLETSQATSKQVTEALSTAARDLKAGDLFVLSYSGHGGQVPDRNGEEPDKLDETWVLYDRQFVDDELYALLGEFAAGVHVLVLSDSCHSGSVTRAETYRLIQSIPELSGDLASMAIPRLRAMPPPVEAATYRHHRALYDRIQKEHKAGDQVDVQAAVILISGCQDNQLSSDGQRNGLFTGTLRTVWKDGEFKGGYRRFHRSIANKMPPWQSPNYFTLGTHLTGFERTKPFTFNR